MKQCNWCENVFKPTVNYQVYCSAECRSGATKEKIVARYLATKRKKRKPKQCAGGCGITLSIYNDDILCNSCKINNKDVARVLKMVKKLSRDSKNTNPE